MSIENAKTFLDRVEMDPAALERVAAMREGEQVAAMAAEMGLPCSADEIKQAVREKNPSGGGIPDRELDAVAGGGSYPMPSYPYFLPVSYACGGRT